MTDKGWLFTYGIIIGAILGYVVTVQTTDHKLAMAELRRTKSIQTLIDLRFDSMITANKEETAARKEMAKGAKR